MYFKVGENRPYLLEDLETKEQHIVDEDDVFIGDD